MDCKNFSFLEQNHDFIGSVIIHSPGKKKCRHSVYLLCQTLTSAIRATSYNTTRTVKCSAEHTSNIIHDRIYLQKRKCYYTKLPIPLTPEQ